MTRILTIAGRELRAYFATPVATVFIVIFLILQGALTFNLGQFFDRGIADLNPFFTFIPWVFLLLIPAITMRLWAEERRLGTIELLLTLPVTQGAGRDWEIPRRLGILRHRAVADVSVCHRRQYSRRAGQWRDRVGLCRLPAGRRRVPVSRRGNVGGDAQSGDRIRAGGGDLLRLRRRLQPDRQRLPGARTSRRSASSPAGSPLSTGSTTSPAASSRCGT